MTDTKESYIDEMADSFVKKKKLILSVEVETREQAIEIISWMYSQNPPMKAKLTEIAWDKALVSARQAELLAALLETK